MALTRDKLQALVSSTSEASSKSVLLQTVALFETLVAKINALQVENDTLKAEKTCDDKFESVIFELEQARKELANVSEVSHWIGN